MINFSIFIFIIYAVYESAANIVFGIGRKKYRRRRRRKACAAAARRKRNRQVVLYKPKSHRHTKARMPKSSALTFYCSIATIACEPSSLNLCSASFFSKWDTFPATESAIR